MESADIMSDTKTVPELVKLAKEFIANAPEYTPSPAGAEGLMGFTGPIGFICSTCSGRILKRGCNLKLFGDVPAWDKAPCECAVCGK